jgi:hypothetical protein
LNYLFGKKPAKEKENSNRVGKNYYATMQHMKAAEATQQKSSVKPDEAEDYSEAISR